MKSMSPISGRRAKILWRRTTLSVALLAAAIICASPLAAQTGRWVSAYYAGWQQESTRLPAGSIDYDAMTHIMHFAVCVTTSSPFINPDCNSLSDSKAAELVDSAHAKGKKALMSVGGADSRDEFLVATNPSNLSTFINGLINLMVARGYDGIDIDWETLDPVQDVERYQAFITALRGALNSRDQSLLLTVAVDLGRSATGGNIFAQVSKHIDQINLMMHDVMNTWQTWASAHGWEQHVPSAETIVQQFINTGVPASKLGIDTDFHGPHRLGGMVNRSEAAEIVRK